MSSFGKAVKVSREELGVGDIVWVGTRIDIRDIAYPRSRAANRCVCNINTHDETNQ